MRWSDLRQSHSFMLFKELRLSFYNAVINKEIASAKLWLQPTAPRNDVQRGGIASLIGVIGGDTNHKSQILFLATSVLPVCRK